MSYYALLRLILREFPELRRCLCHCRHCGIFFIADPRNARRTDLGCPFGCQESYRKQRSSERSAAYYRTSEGRMKKRLQNSRRRRTGLVSKSGEHREGKELAGGAAKPRSSPEGKRSGMVMYLAMVIGLIERRRVRVWEIQRLLERIVRQHSMAEGQGVDYGDGETERSPP